MASLCEVVIAADDEAGANTLARVAIDEVIRIEHKYSRYRPDSIVSQINAAAGVRAIACDEETVALLDFSDSLYRSSDGLFDVTSGVLRRAWNFATGHLPAADELAPLRELVDWLAVEREGAAVRLPRLGMEIDFGGFGKEYAADRAACALIAQGVRHGYVNLAGDMRVIGPRPDAQPWRMGIQHPREPRQVLATIPIEHDGLATSGDYERFFEREGKRYCHILDPRTGMPVTYWRTVSVLAPMAVVAGNCSTIAMLKQAEGLGFLERTGMNYLAVDHLGRCFTKGAIP